MTAAAEVFDDSHIIARQAQANPQQPNQQQPSQQPNQQQPAASNGNNNNAPAASGSGSAAGNATSSAAVSIPPTAAAGGVQMIQPSVGGGNVHTSYYKIADHETITFKWNLTSLYVVPQHLTVVAVNTIGGNTYPVGPTNSPSNTLSGNATEVHWCPYDWQGKDGVPAFQEGTYVLKIYDERGPDARPTGGYLSPYQGVQFGMYIPQPYVSISDGWQCGAACSAATETLKQPMALPILSSLILVLFTTYAAFRHGA